MRIALLLYVLTGVAHADVIVGGAVGAGGQGGATYSAVEARVDGEWRDMRFGLGARGVWLDDRFRSSDWEGWKAVRALRLFEAHGDHVAVAAGGLAPAQLGHVADGYRATLDDRPRTGVRGAVTTEALTINAEIDDVIDPHLIGGAFEVVMGDWIGCAAGAIDPAARDAMGAEHAIGSFEGCAARRWARTGARIDAGGGVVGERLVDGNGMAMLGFVRGAFDGYGARWTFDSEVRAGGGSVGGMFGPLHRIEQHVDDKGVGAAGSIGVIGQRGWLRAFARYRAAGPIGGISAGAPAGKWMQVAGWTAVSKTSAAGAAELRVSWAKRLTSAIEVGRIYDVEAMDVTPRWTATAWFAVQRGSGP